MSEWHRVAGDIGDTISVRLDGAEDLNAATGVEAHVWRAGRASEIKTVLSAAIIDATARSVLVQLGEAGEWLPSIATADDWSIEYEVAFGSTPSITWPSGDPDIIHVRNPGD